MDGEPPQEEDFTQIPLPERSQHKNWKARLSAYTDIIAKSAKTASDTDPFFRPYITDGPLLKRWVTDANVVAQEKGIEAVLAIAQYSGETSAKCRSDVIPPLVEKALGAARAGTKRKGTDLCLMMVEVENTGEGVMGDVLPGLDAKQPKVVAGCVTCLKEMIESFGVTAIGNIKPVMKVLPKIFGHSDKTVRAEGSALVLALYSYLGAALQASLAAAELKPVQLAELQKSFDALDAEGKGAGTGKPSRYTRKVQRERQASEASGGGANGADETEAEEAAVPDARDFLDPVDAFKLFPADLDDRISSTKWKDKVEVLEEINAILSNPSNAKISPANIDSYGSLVQTLGARCKSDSNINVVIEAAKAIEGLAKGIGKPFNRYRGVIMSGLLERLKERKASVADAIGRALDAVFITGQFSDIVDDTLTSLKSKNPQVKEGTLKFLHRSLSTTTDAPGKDQIKPLAESLVALLGDSTEPVRISAADCLGTMMKIFGERVFNPYIEGLSEIQLQKVKDAAGKAEIKYRAGGAGAKSAPGAKPAAATTLAKKPILSSSKPPASAGPSAQSSAPSSPPIKASGRFDADALVDEFAPPAKAPPARFMAKAGALKASAADDSDAPKPPSAVAAARKPPILSSAGPPASKPAPPPASKPIAGPSKPAGSSKALATSPSEPVKYRFSPEDAAAKASEQIPEEYHTKLADSAWKNRLEAAEEMFKWVEEGRADSVDSEVLFRFIGKTPGWNEKIAQVSAKLYEVMNLVAEKNPTFGKPSAALAIGHLSDKLGDLKLKKSSGDALTTFAEKTSLAFVLAQAYEPMTKQKAPKAQADALTWIKQQLAEFGIAGIPLKDLISFVKSALGSPNALVRKAATEVLVTIRVAVGADISGFIEDLNPQLLSTINSEFDKASSQTPPESTRQQADLQEVSAGPGKAGKAGPDPLDDLIPRVDLDKLVNQTSVIADSRSDAWKTRKEAFEALSALLEIKSNSRLKPNMGEIGGVLKKAMADTNLAVKMLALGIISKIAMGMGSAFDKHTRLLTAPVASVCADQKTTTRAAGTAALTAMSDAAGALDTMYSGLATALESPNPALRSTVLAWLAERLTAETPSSSADLSPLAGPIISCLEDRNGDVRKSAGAILPFVVASAGYDHVMGETSRLKPASKATIVPLINNARTASTGTSSAKAETTTAAASKASTQASRAPSGTTSTKSSAPSSPVPTKSSTIPKASGFQPPGRSLVMKALANAPTARPPSALSDDRPTGIPRPKIASSSRPQSTQPVPTSEGSNRTLPFTTSDLTPRAARLKRDTARWVLEASPKNDLIEYLHTQMEPHASPEILQLLFSKDHRAEEDFMAALSAIAEFYDGETAKSFGLADDELGAIQMANIDLAVKYSAIKLLSNNTQLANRCLEVITNVFATLMKKGERFSDAEAKLFMPAIIFKLGDAKFSSKLTPIFETLDKIIAGSQVIQLLVQYGLEDKSAGKTCKNESLALIERAYRKRGSILKVRDDRGFYETLAKCVSDSGTRNAALSVMALLQLQGSSKTLDAVVDSMPNSSKDMLANRRATMATTKPGPGASATGPVAKVTADTLPTAGTPRIRKPVPRLNSPGVDRIQNGNGHGSASPTGSSIPRAPDSPSRLPKLSNGPRSGIPGPSATSRIGTGIPLGIPNLARPVQRDLFTASKPSMQPLGRPSSSSSSSTNNRRPMTDLVQLINDVRQDDVEDVVDTLKELQTLLDEGPDRFLNVVSTLVDTLVDELERAFTPKENLQDPAYFRLVKHILQTMSSVSGNEPLLRKLTYDNVYSFFDSLTLHLVQSDQMAGHFRELSKFINLILIQILAQTDRLTIFQAMFRLLYHLSADFGAIRVMAGDQAAVQADLVMKCLWKRSKVLDDDFASGRLSIGGVFRIIEEFISGVGPSEWRRRGQTGIALGDMPLRTVKSMIQKIVGFCKMSGEEVYDILVQEFGDDAANTTVYAYVFRLSGATDRATSPGPNDEEEQPARRQRSETSGSRPQSSAVASTGGSTSSSPPRQQSQSQDEESEAARMIRTVMRAGNANQHQDLDALYRYSKADPSQEAEVERAISSIQSSTVQTYFRRVLEQRRSRDNPSPSRPESLASPVRSPTQRDPEYVKQPRRSMGPRPSSVVVDKTAPPDAQLADYKNLFFNRGSGNATLRASQSQEQRSGGPLSEFGRGANALERDVD